MEISEFAQDEQVSPYQHIKDAPQAICGTLSTNQGPTTVGKEQWAALGSGNFRAVGRTIKKLPSAMYSLSADESGLLFIRKPIEVDDLIKFPDSLADTLLAEIDEFWSKDCEGKFSYYGYLQRRGYMLYGPQGGGKTCICQLIVQDIIKRGGLVILANCNPGLTSDALQQFREVEQDRPIVCLFEDIDSIINQWGEANLLSLLDGENQVTKVCNVATTNFPEQLPRRIISRPRRFDRVIKIGFPPEEHRRIYFTTKLKIDSKEVDQWVKATHNFSFAACAELVISVKCLGNDFDETVAVLNKLNEGKASSAEFDEKPGFGFASNGADKSCGKQMLPGRLAGGNSKH